MAENNDVRSRTITSPGKKKGMSFALSAFIVGVGTVIVKLSGLIRDIVLSMMFSERVFRDSFKLAFNIPDLFYNLLVGGAIYSTIAPYLSSKLAVGKEKEGIRVVNIFISMVIVAMLIVCTLGTIFSEPIYTLYALGKEEINQERLILAANASKFLFPQIFFIMLAALCNGILTAYRKFTITSFGPVLYNILVIASIVVLGGNSQRNLTMTTAGILVSTIIYFIFQYSLGFKQVKNFRLSFHPSDKEFLMLFRRAIPILISASIVQINVIVLNHFGLLFDEGSIYGYGNASSIWQIPYTVFVVAITTVMTPELAGDYESKKFTRASILVSHSLKSALFMTIPSAVFIAVMNLDVVKAVYQWSAKYTDDDARVASVFLIGFCTSIITATVVHVFNQAFYAIGQTKLPLVAGVLGLIINPIACQILISLGVGPLSLSIAYSFTNLCQMIILAVLYCRRKELAPFGIVRFLVKSALCSLVMAGSVFLLDKFMPAQGGKMTQLIIISVKGLLAVVVYFATAVLFKMEEATYWIDKFFKKKKAAPKTAS